MPAPRVPLLEGAPLDGDAMVASHRRHLRVGLDPEDVASALGEEPRGLAGPAPDVEDASAGSTP